MRADTRWMVSISAREKRSPHTWMHIRPSVAYHPSIDTWNGRDKIQINIQSYFKDAEKPQIPDFSALFSIGNKIDAEEY